MRDPSSPKDDHRAGGGSSNTPSAFEATYALEDEDHTLGNCLRFQLNKNPAVALAGYSVPHPMERKVNVRGWRQTARAHKTFRPAVRRFSPRVA